MTPPRPAQFQPSRVIDKQSVPVVIATTAARIEASLHVMINHRPSDVLNDDSRFIALTDATITPQDGGPAERHPFLALNKASIIRLHER